MNTFWFKIISQVKKKDVNSPFYIKGDTNPSINKKTEWETGKA